MIHDLIGCGENADDAAGDLAGRDAEPERADREVMAAQPEDRRAQGRGDEGRGEPARDGADRGVLALVARHEHDTLLVADYRGLTMPQIDELRTRLLATGARFTVVKNTLTRRAAEAAGAEALLTLLEGPSAIAFLEPDGDLVAAAQALAAPAHFEQGDMRHVEYGQADAVVIMDVLHYVDVAAQDRRLRAAVVRFGAGEHEPGICRETDDGPAGKRF